MFYRCTHCSNKKKTVLHSRSHGVVLIGINSMWFFSIFQAAHQTVSPEEEGGGRLPVSRKLIVCIHCRVVTMALTQNYPFPFKRLTSMQAARARAWPSRASTSTLRSVLIACFSFGPRPIFPHDPDSRVDHRRINEFAVTDSPTFQTKRSLNMHTCTGRHYRALRTTIVQPLG